MKKKQFFYYDPEETHLASSQIDVKSVPDAP